MYGHALPWGRRTWGGNCGRVEESDDSQSSTSSSKSRRRLFITQRPTTTLTKTKSSSSGESRCFYCLPLRRWNMMRNMGSSSGDHSGDCVRKSFAALRGPVWGKVHPASDPQQTTRPSGLSTGKVHPSLSFARSTSQILCVKTYSSGISPPWCHNGCCNHPTLPQPDVCSAEWDQLVPNVWKVQ